MHFKHRSSIRSTRRAAVAIAVGALAVSGAVLAPVGVASAAAVDVEPGMEIQIKRTVGGGAATCTLAFTGTRGPDAIGFTAGHCGDKGATVFSGGTQIGTITQSASPAVGPGGEVLDANAADWAIVTFNSNTTVKPASTRVVPRSVGTARVRDEVCSQGRTTGWKCGQVTGTSGYWITTTIRRDRGDSGGPLIRTSDGAALGILSSVEISGPRVPGTGSLGSSGGGAPGSVTSRYFSLTEAMQRSGAQLSTVGDAAARGRTAPRNIPAPSAVTPAPLPKVAARF